ncbi:hypothetical protein GEMRC1_002965 [Eukaryota sp. GEM-RC1]
MTWSPSQQGIDTLTNILKQSQVPDETVQQQLLQQLNHFSKTVPDFPLYLAFILSHSTEVDVSIRQTAGLVLRGHIASHFSKDVTVPAELQTSLLHLILEGLKSSKTFLRDVAASCLSSLFPSLTSPAQLFSVLIHRLKGSDTMDACFGALLAIRRFAEDNPSLLSQHFSPDLLTPLIAFLSTNYLFFQTHALATFRFLLSFTTIPIPLRSSLSTLVPIFISLLNDAQDANRQGSVSVILAIINNHSMFIEAHISDLTNNLVKLIQYDDEAIACEAADAITFLACTPELSESAIASSLSSLIPALFKRIPFSEFDSYQAIERSQETIDTPDDEASVAHEILTGQTLSDDSGDLGFYSCRNACCGCLDMVSMVHRETILPFLMPALTQSMSSSDWTKQEGALLALGAVVSGTCDGLITQLGEIIPYLINILTTSTSKNPTKIMASWVLSRFIAVIIRARNSDLMTSLGQIFTCWIDTLKTSQSKEVIRSAASGLAQLIAVMSSQCPLSQTEEIIKITVDVSLSTFERCFNAVRPLSTLLYLWNCIAESLAGKKFTEEFRNEIMSKLLKFLAGLVSKSQNLSNILSFCIADCLVVLLSVPSSASQQFEKNLTLSLLIVFLLY